MSALSDGGRIKLLEHSTFKNCEKSNVCFTLSTKPSHITEHARWLSASTAQNLRNPLTYLSFYSLCKEPIMLGRRKSGEGGGGVWRSDKTLRFSG